MSVALIDTHAHLDEDAFSQDLDEVLGHAAEAGVTEILTIGTTLASSLRAVELARQYPQVHAVIGIQPNYVAEAKPGDWEQIVQLANEETVVAIGETGLDRYWDFAPFDQQVEYFRLHMALASELHLPFVVHCREAEADVVEELKQAAGSSQLRGVMHSFAGDAQTAKICCELGMHISFAGMLTYKKNNELREVAAGIPLERLLVETDSPYLSPEPRRGKRNEPAFVKHTAERLAELHGKSLAEMAEITTANARRLFALSDQV